MKALVTRRKGSTPIIIFGVDSVDELTDDKSILTCTAVPTDMNVNPMLLLPSQVSIWRTPKESVKFRQDMYGDDYVVTGCEIPDDVVKNFIRGRIRASQISVQAVRLAKEYGLID